MRSPLPQAPEIKSMAEMLDVLSKPEEYQKRMTALQEFLNAVNVKLGVYDTLDKVQAYHKEVKDDAARAAKSKVEADKLWVRVEQASADVAARQQELNDYQASLNVTRDENVKAMEKATNTLHAAEASQQAELEALATTKAQLQAERAAHETRKARYKDKLDALRIAIHDVTSL